MTPSKYFDQLNQDFLEENPCVLNCTIAGESFDLLFPTEKALAAYNCSFQERKNSDSNFKVHIWDSEKRMIEPGWKSSQYKKKGEIEGFNSSRYKTVYDVGSRVLSMADLETRVAHFWTPSLNELPFWEYGSPLRNILHWLLPLEKKRMVHAAGVGTKEGGVLIVGKGGSGKSTTALSCLETDLLYLGDDYCAVKDDKCPTAHHLYSNAKVGPKNSQKKVIGIPQEKIISQFPIQAIFFPVIKNLPEPKLEKLSVAVTLREMAASTILQLPGENKEMLPFFSSIVKKVPCFALHLSNQLDKNAKLIERFLK